MLGHGGRRGAGGASPLNAKCWSLVQAPRATNNSPMPSSLMLLSVCCMCEIRAVLRCCSDSNSNVQLMSSFVKAVHALNCCASSCAPASVIGVAVHVRVHVRARECCAGVHCCLAATQTAPLSAFWGSGARVMPPFSSKRVTWWRVLSVLATSVATASSQSVQHKVACGMAMNVSGLSLVTSQYHQYSTTQYHTVPHLQLSSQAPLQHTTQWNVKMFVVLYWTVACLKWLIAGVVNLGAGQGVCCARVH